MAPQWKAGRGSLIVEAPVDSAFLSCALLSVELLLGLLGYTGFVEYAEEAACFAAEGVLFVAGEFASASVAFVCGEVAHGVLLM